MGGGQGTDRRAGGRDGRRAVKKKKPHNHEQSTPNGAPKGKTPPPTAASTPCACVVLASCLRHACYKGKTTRATRGMTLAECGPPPARTPRQGGEAAERECGTNHTTVPKGSTRRRASPNGGTTGGATAGKVGSHMASPPPLQRDKCRASCLRRACDVLTPEDGQRDAPPPHPLHLDPPKKGARTAGRRRGDMGGGRGQTETPGGETRGEQKKKKQRTPTRQSRGRQQGQTGHGGSQKARQGARERGTPCNGNELQRMRSQ